MRRTRRAGMVALFVAVALTAVLMVGVATAFAGAPDVVGGGNTETGFFLCPATGAGVLNSPQLEAGQLPAEGFYTFLPGHNQSGNNVNVNGTNGEGLPSPTNYPGDANTFWSPIWNANPIP